MDSGLFLAKCPKCGQRRFDTIARSCERRQCGYVEPADRPVRRDEVSDRELATQLQRMLDRIGPSIIPLDRDTIREAIAALSPQTPDPTDRQHGGAK